MLMIIHNWLQSRSPVDLWDSQSSTSSLVRADTVIALHLVLSADSSFTDNIMFSTSNGLSY